MHVETLFFINSLADEETRSRGGPTVTHIVWRSLERRNFPELNTIPYTLWLRCYVERYNQRYGNSVHVGDGACRNFAFNIAAKPLQV